MAFMQPHIEQSDYLRVTTNAGDEIVPADLVRVSFAIDYRAGGYFSEDNEFHSALARAIAPYCEGSDIGEIWPMRGFLARMSAPGYMDCTDWSAHATEEEARAYLAEMYGDDSDEPEGDETTPQYRREFPDFPAMPEVSELLALGFTDSSWHNDSAPTFVSADMTTRVWIEHPDADKREEPGQVRFAVERGDFNPETSVGVFNPDMAYQGNEWAEVLRIVKGE